MIKVALPPYMVLEAFHGLRIDVVLARIYPDYSRSQFSHWLKKGFISLNQKPCKPKDSVRSGDEITFFIEDFFSEEKGLPEAEAIPLSIAYEDDEVLVVNKPAGLVVHPGAGNQHHTLVNALLYYNPDLQVLPRAGIVHRLDKDTTGLLIVAKTFSAYTFLGQQMRERLIERHYLALVQGALSLPGKIQTFYGRHPQNRLKMAVLPSGREAITHYTAEKNYAKAYTLLNVHLLTGRTHQIRVHCAHIHHPLVGDRVYGGKLSLPIDMKEPLKSTLTAFNRQALHAKSIRFTHPQTLESVYVESQVPPDFSMLLSHLEMHFESDIS